ncbi:DUF3854 domain-containing protein [Chamaesiphon sp. VAR_48_metabat_403]|uniref:DUF3854 domain-containing protein n=1 Tax=Chamaesiphon sp. VAR_48_metabat_403 TaxID=2964700 RepID=UPI00286DB185|nr:DUF3854 domain-containing protein [Chamaesiphon sp. VAR_48_metabat_403]
MNFKDIIDTDCFTISNKNECKRLTGYSLTGLIIPYFDPTGKPYTTAKGAPFYRIKPDWSFAENPDECPKYLSPKGEGNRPYFAPTYKQWDKALRFNKIPVHIVEGEKKAAKLGACGIAAIGLSGVHGWTDKTVRNEEHEEIAHAFLEDNEDRDSELNQHEESRAIPELEQIGGANFWKHRTVYIDFDSDVVQKWQVRSALKKLATWLHSKGADVYIVLIPNELNGDKNGVDDFIFRHGIEAYEKLVKAAEPAFVRGKKKLTFNLPTDPGLFQKASLLWGVLKEHWRYRPGIGWHQWLGDRWDLTDDGAGTYIDEDIYKFLAANNWQAQGNGSLANLLRHMKAKLMVREWNPKNKIAFSNGVLDIETREFTIGHRREDFMTVALPYRYDPSIECPKWLNFLKESLKGETGAIELVQAFFRWAILPKPEGKLDIEVGWDLYGRGGTGKGTVLETLKNTIGHHNCGGFDSKSLGNPNILAGMLDKRVSISSDDSGHMEEFGLYGKIMSNERVNVKLLYKNVFPTTLNTFLVRAYNNFITMPSGAKGMDRRVVAMSFDRQPETIDPYLQDKINGELSGVFNWAWEISNTEMKRRILWAGEVTAVKEATTEMFYANNPALIFLQEKYPNGGTKVLSRELYKEYTNWYLGDPKHMLGHRKFCDAIKNYGGTQLSKTNGHSPFNIPALKDVDVLQKFGILRGKTKKTEVEIEPKTGNNRELGNNENSYPLPDPTLFPVIPFTPASDSADLGDFRELGNNCKENSSALLNSENSDTTNIDSLPKSITLIAPIPPIEAVIPTPSPNPKGTITYTTYLMGEIANVCINFERQSLAKEWRDYIALAFGFYGTVRKAATATGKYKWQLFSEKFDRDALGRIERKDLSKIPQRG